MTVALRMGAPILARPHQPRLLAGAVALLLLLVPLAVLSLALGSRDIPLDVTLDALLAFDGSTEHRIVWEMRLERTLLGLAIGAGLGAGGAVMQAVTRNPLADPGLLGVNAGASLAVVLAIAVLGLTRFEDLVWFAMAGAAVASVAVYALGGIGRTGVTPVRLALVGAALSALLFALVRLVILVDLGTLDRFRFWGVGSLAGSDAEALALLAPLLALGLALALACGAGLNALALGEEAARGLGVRVGALQAGTILCIALLCGASVAAVGPVGFVGLVIPHAARAWCGPDQRWIAVYAALLGPAFVLGCDVLGRVALRPAEVPVGVTTAALGGLAFIILARRVRMAQP